MNSYNLMIFLQGISFMFCLVVGAYFISFRKNKLKELMGVVLFYWAILILKDFILLGGNFILNFYNMTLSMIVDGTALPGCMLLLMEVVKPGWVNKKRICVNVSPFIAEILLFLFIPNETMANIIMIFDILYAIGVIIAVCRSIPQYNYYIKSQYSYTENINISWLTKLLLMFLLVSFFWIYSCIMLDWFVDSFYYAGTILLWWVAAYFVNKQNVSIEYLNLKHMKQNQLASMDLELKMNDAKIDQSLIDLFEKDKIFLKSDLTLQDVCNKLQINKDVLNYYFTNSLNVCFYNFVNDYRIEYAREMLLSDAEIPIFLISETSGFRSVSTFNKNFMEKYIESPKNYRMCHFLSKEK